MTLRAFPSRSPFVLLLVVLALLAPLGCGGRGERAGDVYYCPMHPTYVSDRPGSCPICNMDLVKKGVGTATPVAAPEAHRHEAEAGGLVSCPMHPAIVSDRPGICARCGMDLTPAPAGASLPAQVWSCPMHPEVAAEGPATCPKCKMDLEPRATSASRAAEVPGHATVETDAEGLRLAGVRTEPARRERFSRSIRTVGTVMADESRLYRAQTRISGWVEKLHVNFTGQSVRRGQPMLSIYSPELLASQEEYLLARRNAERFLASSIPEVRRGGEDLVAAARRRLELFDVPESFLAELERSGKARRSVDLLAPASGYVVSKEVLAGRQVEPGMELYTVADLSHVWVEADFYESEARFLRVGQAARLTLAYDPTTALAGEIAYIYPELNVESRTLRVRFDLPNPEMKLRPGMFVDVEQSIDLGEGTVVPDSAVLDTGLRQIVFVETAPGRFEPRLVSVLWRGEGRAQLAPGGVAEGERVAVKANFLLDSESRLRSALAALVGEGVPTPGPHDGHGPREGDR